MSTRCLIGLREKDNKVSYIYCHNGGEPRRVGKMLVEYYSDKRHLRDLLSLGDMSSLGKYPLSTPGGWEDRTKVGDKCLTYADRSEDVPAKTAESVKDYLAIDCWQNYMYLFDPEENKWYFLNCGDSEGLKEDLKEYLIEEGSYYEEE